MKLGDRLESLAVLAKRTDVIADVGLDHGFLTIELINRGLCNKVIGTDLNRGPIENARKNIVMAGLSNQVTLICSDGLKAVPPGQANAAIIAGMGGELIMRILEDSMETVKQMDYLIIQPQSVQDEVRMWIEKNGFAIDHEILSEDNGKFYEAIRIVKGDWHPPKAHCYETGVFLSENKELFQRFAAHRIKSYSFALEQMKKSSGDKVEEQRIKMQTRIDHFKEALL